MSDVIVCPYCASDIKVDNEDSGESYDLECPYCEE
jgi:uncharacterized protein YbaR (Trm112 family)